MEMKNLIKTTNFSVENRKKSWLRMKWEKKINSINILNKEKKRNNRTLTNSEMNENVRMNSPLTHKIGFDWESGLI